jgi:hypothetical protein
MGAHSTPGVSATVAKASGWGLGAVLGNSAPELMPDQRGQAHAHLTRHAVCSFAKIALGLEIDHHGISP